MKCKQSLIDYHLEWNLKLTLEQLICERTIAFQLLWRNKLLLYLNKTMFKISSVPHEARYILYDNDNMKWSWVHIFRVFIHGSFFWSIHLVLSTDPVWQDQVQRNNARFVIFRCSLSLYLYLISSPPIFNLTWFSISREFEESAQR